MPNKPSRRLLIGILSAQGYHQRRDACRRTWVAEARNHPEVEVVFLLGGGPSHNPPSRVEDQLIVPCRDDYDSLPQKVYHFLAWALRNYEFQFVFKCDDDTYVHFQRLMQYDFGEINYVGADVGGYASGGAGYRLTHRAASAILPDLQRILHGPEDLLVGQALRNRGFGLVHSGLFRSSFVPGYHPTADNQIITGHHVNPELMLQIHASLAQPAPSRAASPYQVLDWATGWGLLGFNGDLGHDVQGATRVQLPDIPIDWDSYTLISGHVDSRVEIRLDHPVGIFGFMEGHSWNVPHAPVEFSIDGNALGTLVGPGERTAERRLAGNRHTLRMTTRGPKTRRYPVWAIRQLSNAESFRIVMPTSNRYVRTLDTTLALLDRFWPGHPSVDVVHHEQVPELANTSRFFAGRQTEVSWCEAVAKYLVEANHDELVLLLLDDYGLCQPVNTRRVAEAAALMREDLSLGAFFLTWMMLPTAEPYPHRDDIIIWPRWSYSVHTQAALWRRTSLLRTLRRVGRQSIGAFEIAASQIFNEHEFVWEKHASFRLSAPASPSLFLDTCDKTNWPIGYHNLWHQGQPDLRHQGFLRAEGF